MKQVVVINMRDPEVRRFAQMKIWRRFVLERLVAILQKMDDVTVFLGIGEGEFVKLNPELRSRLKQAKVEIFDPCASLEDAEKVRSVSGNLICSTRFLESWVRSGFEINAYCLYSPFVFSFCTDESSIHDTQHALFNDSKKETDGWISKKINAIISLPISRFLSRYSLHPNWITLFNVPIAFLGPWFCIGQGYLSAVLAGLFFQLGSILDGCDGEIARVKLQTSKFGGWFDTAVDNFSYLLFFFSVGYWQADHYGNSLYFKLMLACLAFLLFFLLATYIGMRRMRTETHHVYRQTLYALSKDSRLLSGVRRLGFLSKRENFALGIMFLCLLNLRGVIYWILLVGLFLYSMVVLGTFPKLYRKIREGAYA